MSIPSQEELSVAVKGLLEGVFHRANGQRGKNGLNSALVMPMAEALFNELAPDFFSSIGIAPDNATPNAVYLRGQMKHLIERAVGDGGAAEPGPRKGFFGPKQPADTSRFFRIEDQNIQRFVHHLETLPTSLEPPKPHPYPPVQSPPVPSAAPKVDASESVNAADLLAKLTDIQQETLPAVMLGVHKGELREAGTALVEIDQVITKADKDLKGGIVNGAEKSEVGDKLRSIATQMAVAVYEDRNTGRLLEQHGGVDFEELAEKYCPYGTTPVLGHSNHPADNFMNTREMEGILREGHVRRGNDVYFNVHPCSPTSAAQVLAEILQEETQFLNHASPLDVTPDIEAASQARTGVIERWLEKEDRLQPVVREWLETAMESNRTALEGINSQQLFSQSELRDAIGGITRNSQEQPGGRTPSTQNPKQEKEGPSR